MGRCCGGNGLLNRARGITVSPGTNSTNMVVVGISLGGTPGCGVSIDGGTSVVEDSHVVEGEGTGRSGCRAVIGDAACTRTSASHGSRSRPGNLSISSDLASEATRVLPLVRPELDPESPGLTGGREDLSKSIFI